MIKLNKLLAVGATSLLLFSSQLMAVQSQVAQDKNNSITCEADVRTMLAGSRVYETIYQTLAPFIPQLEAQLLQAQETNGANYATLLALCRQIVALLPTGRIVLTDPDGLVIVDTGKPDGGGPNMNNWTAAQDGANPATFMSAINVNHNSRVSIINAQQWPCGVGVETKFSNSVHVNQNYVSIRLGAYLDSVGTVRMSVNEGAI